MFASPWINTPSAVIPAVLLLAATLAVAAAPRALPEGKQPDDARLAAPEGPQWLFPVRGAQVEGDLGRAG